MPAPAVKPEVPPAEMRDRQEGYGMLGTIFDYPEYRDNGEWPWILVRNNEFQNYPSETNDPVTPSAERTRWSHIALEDSE